MNDKQVEQIIKFFYYLLGIKIALFAFVVSELIDLKYQTIHLFLFGALLTLALGTILLLFLIAISISILGNRKYKTKKVRRLFSVIGMLFGLSFALIISWLMLFKGIISF